jgi:hypothetical protein
MSWMAWIRFLEVQDFSLLHSFRSTLGPTQPPIQSVPGDLSPGVKWLGHEGDHSLEVKNGDTIPSLPHMSSGHSA